MKKAKPAKRKAIDPVKKLRKELSLMRSRLNEKEAMFDSITERALAGYWVWYIPERKMFISPHLKAMIGYRDDELENSPETISKCMHPSDLPDTYNLLGKHIESNGKIPFEIEVRYKHKNGSLVWVICSGNIVQRDKKGNPTVMIGCHIDNTELKKAEDIGKYARQLEQKSMEMEQFAYIASHDLQEPLNTIQGFITLLGNKLKTNPDPEILQYLNYINVGTTRMSSLIKGLLEYSRIGKETLMLRVNCNDLVKEVIADLSQSIRESNANVKIDALPTSMMGYDLELRILFQNLISNALKFRSADPPMISITCDKGADFWNFKVSDNGIGIETPYQEKIFKLYQRLHPKGEYEGNGLGLAQCHKIVTEFHNGRIWVEPNFPKGSIFNFTIPIGL